MRAVHSETQFITALGLGQICAWGTLYYSYPLIVEAMMPELGWTRSQAYAPATFGLLIAAFLTYPIGVAVDRGYGKAVLTGCSALAAVLFLAWSQVRGLYGFYIVATLLGALQACTLYEPAFAVLARRVGADRARQGVTRITLWGGFSSTVFIPVVQFLIERWSWREALWCLAAVNVSLAILYSWQVRPRLDRQNDGTPGTAAVSRDRKALAESLRNRVFWLLIVAMVAYAGAFSAFTFHMYPMLLEGGLQMGQVVFALAMIGPSQVAGRILVSMVGERSSIRRIGCWTVAVLPPVFPGLLLFGDRFLAVAALCCAYGAANGIFTIVRSLVIPEMVTRHAYGALNGIINLPATLARAVAPWTTAMLWETTSSYGPVWWVIAATAMVMAIAFWAAAWQSLQCNAIPEVPVTAQELRRPCE